MDSPLRLIAALLLVGLLGLAGAFSSSPTQTGDEDPKPFDPLSEAEQHRAIETAITNASVQATLSERNVEIGAALHTEKVDPITEMARMADVWFYDYTTDEALRVVVDLDTSNVQELVPLPDQQPPLTAQEIDTATQMALEDLRVQERLPDGQTRSLGYLWTGDATTACQVNRCVLVGFVIDGERADTYVRVNLSTDTVETILDASLEPLSSTPRGSP